MERGSSNITVKRNVIRHLITNPTGEVIFLLLLVEVKMFFEGF
jgi:hypothetical protein